jgi:hypothetical protein
MVARWKGSNCHSVWTCRSESHSVQLGGGLIAIAPDMNRWCIYKGEHCSYKVVYWRARGRVSEAVSSRPLLVQQKCEHALAGLAGRGQLQQIWGGPHPRPSWPQGKEQRRRQNQSVHFSIKKRNHRKIESDRSGFHVFSSTLVWVVVIAYFYAW